MASPSYRQGDVILVNWPFTDGSASKARPAILAAVVINDYGSDDVILCAISSVDGMTGIRISESHADFGNSGLMKASRILPSKIHTMAKTLIIRKIGSINAPLLAEVKAGIRQSLTL